MGWWKSKHYLANIRDALGWLKVNTLIPILANTQIYDI